MAAHCLFLGLMMKTYVQFFTYSTGYVAGTTPPRFDDTHKKLIEACGDRGIIQIDSRLSDFNMGLIVRETCQKRGYEGYQILKGNSLLDAKPVSGVFPISIYAPDNSSMSAYRGA